MRREPPVRKTPLDDPVTCAHIRQGLSNTFLPAYPPERGDNLIPVANHLFAERAAMPLDKARHECIYIYAE